MGLNVSEGGWVGARLKWRFRGLYCYCSSEKRKELQAE